MVEQIINIWHQLLIMQMPVSIVLVLLLLILIINIATTVRRRLRSNKRGKMVATSIRRGKRRKVQDRIHDVLFDLWCEGILDREDYHFYCTDMGLRYQFPDLIGRKRTAILHPKVLKRKLHALKKTLRSNKEKRDKIKAQTAPKTAAERLLLTMKPAT